MTTISPTPMTGFITRMMFSRRPSGMQLANAAEKDMPSSMKFSTGTGRSAFTSAPSPAVAASRTSMVPKAWRGGPRAAHPAPGPKAHRSAQRNRKKHQHQNACHRNPHRGDLRRNQRHHYKEHRGAHQIIQRGHGHEGAGQDRKSVV